MRSLGFGVRVAVLGMGMGMGLGTSGCAREGAGAHDVADQREARLTSAELVPLGSAAAPPAQVKLSGAILSASHGFMPAANNGGKTQGWIEVFANWTMDPPLPAGKAPKDFLAFNDTVSIATVAPPIASAGKCTLTAGGLEAAGGSFTLTATEPGCDSMKMLDEKLAAPVTITTRAVWTATKTPVPVTITLTPKAK
jgi:hypothetical protein